MTHPNRQLVVAALKSVVGSAFPPPPDTEGEIKKYYDEFIDIDRAGAVTDFTTDIYGTQEEADQAFLDEVTKVYDQLKALPNRMAVYRDIKVPSVDYIGTDDFGMYWSFKKEHSTGAGGGSYSHRRASESNWYQLEITADKKNINWYLSIARNLEWPEEYEIIFDKEFKTEAKVYDKAGKFLKTLAGEIKP